MVTLDKAKPVSQCQKRQEGDEYVCWICNALRWGVDESTPKVARCQQVSRDTKTPNQSRKK